jgi:hypothetical protein
MWVQVEPELSPKEVPGMDEELLTKVGLPGGSFEEKIQCVTDVFRTSARKLESLQTLLRRRAIDNREEVGLSDALPLEVKKTIVNGTYVEDLLDVFDGQSFPLYSKEIVPGHEYCLALEVHSGGSYWSGVSKQEADAIQHSVETVTACSAAEGSATIVAQYGAAQRGAVFVWRWRHLPDRGPYNLPRWMHRVLGTEGNDPLQKLQEELAVVRRWEQQVRANTARYVKAAKELKDPYIREVLRLWPSQVDAQGVEELKKCAWIEGLDSKLIVGRAVLVVRVPFDDYHNFALHATIAKRHQNESLPQENNPPYRLTTTWQWAPADVAGNNTGVAELQVPAWSVPSRHSQPTLLQGARPVGWPVKKEAEPTADYLIAV